MPGLSIDDEHAALYSVGQVADMLEVQQAFLRRLDDEDVVSPSRSSGGQRRYSRSEINQLQHVVGLVSEGLTLTGVRRVMELESRVKTLEKRVAELQAEQPHEGSRTKKKGY